MEALKDNKIIGNQNDGRAVFLFLPNTGTLGAGPEPVCHQFTGANFIWNS